MLKREAEEIDHLVTGCLGGWDELQRLASVQASRELSSALDAAVVAVAEGAKEREREREDARAREKNMVIEREERERSRERERVQIQASTDNDRQERREEAERTLETLAGLMRELSVLKEELEAMRVKRESEHIEESAEKERTSKMVAELRTEVVCVNCMHANMHAYLHA